MSTEELNKIITVKKMDLEECEQELNSRYYPSIVRVAMMNYILTLQDQLEKFNHAMKK
ncbi:hypothetical protein J7E63_05545 [Bacillus sp. ISL-75]|jgi:hypothetical protein|uniref:Uncharacterized protein n=1 Tax=Priestia megaterium TaxID=1404 RepID=A0A6H1NW97_PRIMG|nr:MULTISPECIES: hypothetical protein [Bacillaceae]MBT2726403.1 hypothetical protein [Bacillus sp. ISL-75]QIZ05538.1 hypothetical protein HFZ78_01210 [Priestia megaterium]